MQQGRIASSQKLTGESFLSHQKCHPGNTTLFAAEAQTSRNKVSDTTPPGPTNHCKTGLRILPWGPDLKKSRIIKHLFLAGGNVSWDRSCYLWLYYVMNPRKGGHKGDGALVPSPLRETTLRDCGNCHQGHCDSSLLTSLIVRNDQGRWALHLVPAALLYGLQEIRLPNMLLKLLNKAR